MPNLKLEPIGNDKPVKLTVEGPAAVRRDLIAYAEALAREAGQPIGQPSKLIVPMIERFMATDRGFTKTKRASVPKNPFTPANR